MSSDGAMRCDTGNIYYNVRTLKAGELVRVDGEGGGWLRVEYPSGTKAYVRADEASFDAATKSVKLIKATKLMAANEGGARPWWPLMTNDVAAGTTFAAAEAVRGADGAVDGYLIAAPSGAHGFIRAEQAREATPAEISRASGVVASQPTATAASEPAAAPKTQASLDAAASALVAASTTTESKPAPQASVPVVAPTPTVTPPADDPKLIEVKSGPAPAPTLVETPQPAPARAQTQPAKPEITKRIDDIKVLRDMFERALQPGTSETEVSTVISEFNRSIDSLATTGDEGKIRAGLQQRMTALKMRQEIIDTKRKLADTSEIDEQMRQIKLAVEHVQQQAIYATVGRMLPSTVYDGKRGMPLMYRVESADFSSTRTIGYVIPTEGMDLLPYLGKIVGIVGETRMDPALSLNIIAPTRIDEMRVTGGKLEVVPGPATSETPPRFAPEGSSMTAPTPVPAKPGAAPAPKQAEPSAAPRPVATPVPDEGDMNK
ncbi:MAG TPA: hypothetical protein VHC70_04630 [Phycisphaerales bacterium]|nr:hypothetical protein [Phycisphaerales bacterium]